MNTRSAAGMVVLATVIVGISAASASITCEQSGGDPLSPTVVRIVIESPEPGAVVTPTGACGGNVIVRGSWSVEAPPPLFDFYVVIDASGSAGSDSGADVDGDGLFGDPDDTIYLAEIAAAEAFVGALEPASSRVAVIVFNRDAVVRQQLTTDLAACLATLDAMKGDRPRWGTGYVDAMEAVRLEMLARGDLARREQRCIFLSDGVPDEPLAQTDAKARELAALGLVMDTFALGFPDSQALLNMATITLGRFTALLVPGDIVALLPSFIPDVVRVFESEETLAGSAGTVVMDDAAGTFEATVPLRPGPNLVTLTLLADGASPVSVTCTLDLTMTPALTPDAGPSMEACARGTVRLDGSASGIACGVPLYRWLDCTGAVVVPWSSSPFADIEPCALPCAELTLEIGCEGETCTATATTEATCLSAPQPLPTLVAACDLVAALDCGSAVPGIDATWDLAPDADSDGDGDPANDADVSGCAFERDFGTAGRQDVVAWIFDPSTGCIASAPLSFTLTPAPPPRNLDGGLCPEAIALFSCGTPDGSSTYWWDFDGLTDADLDGDATNDHDADGCDASAAWSGSTTVSVNGWSMDASGCVRLLAQGLIDVSDSATPGEAGGLRVTRSGDSVTIAWDRVPGAPAHRVLRGELGPLQAAGIYDHAADDAASRGACEVRGPRTFTDADDVAQPEAYYYLVTAINDCGGEGPAGDAFDGRSSIPRPSRVSSASCP